MSLSSKYYNDYNKLVIVEFINLIFLLFFVLIGMGDKYSDIVVVFIYTISMLCIFIIDPNMLVKYFQFILNSTWSTVAVFMLENMSVTVADNKSYHYGSLALYVFSWQIFYLVIVIFEKYNVKKQIKVYEKFENLCYETKQFKINTICIIVLTATLIELIAFASVFTKPYFMYGVDRVAYVQTALPTWLNGHIGFFALILPFAIVVIDKDRKLSLLYIILYFLINLWCGEKFTGLFLGVYFIALSFVGLYGFKLNKTKIKKIVYIVVFIMMIFMIGVYFQMSVVGGRDFGYYIKERVSAQGYLWWLTYANDSHNGMHLNEFGDEVTPFITNLSGVTSDYNFGIYKLMKLYYLPNRLKNMLDYGLRGTESSRATFFYYGKIPGLIIGQFILAIMTCKIINKCFEYLKQRNYIGILFAFYILRNFIAVYSMSDFYLLVKPTMLVSYIFLLIGGKISITIKNKLPQIKLKRSYKIRFRRSN